MSTDMALRAELFAELAATRPAGNWQQVALCAEADPELFYPEARESAPQAKAICMVCEVRVQCLAAAIVAREPHGIWGGLTYHERLNLTRELRRAGHAVPQRHGRHVA